MKLKIDMSKKKSKKLKEETEEPQKKINWETVLMVIIPLAALYGVYSFIITNYIYYLAIVAIALILTFIDYYFIKKPFRNSYFITFFMMLVFVYAVSSFTLMAYKDYSKTEIFIVKLNSCSNTGKGNTTVSFKLKNTKCNKLLNFNGYSQQDLIDNYYITLELKQPIRDVFYIEHMSLIHRDTLRSKTNNTVKTK